MSRQKKHMISALLLLMVFSLNTLAGFACSLGVDMGYNTRHHKHNTQIQQQSLLHAPGHGHLHNKYFSSHPTFSSTNDDCCANQVNDFARLEKSLPNTSFLVKPLFLADVSSPKFLMELKEDLQKALDSKFQFVRRSCSLHHTDIRISIQSFQI